jgi:hypothetical protein
MALAGPFVGGPGPTSIVRVFYGSTFRRRGRLALLLASPARAAGFKHPARSLGRRRTRQPRPRAAGNQSVGATFRMPGRAVASGHA